MLDQITPLLITYNEEANLPRVLEPLSWAKTIVVVDSFSTDGTLRLLERRPGVELLQRSFTSFADQCSHGLAKITTDWVLSLDADYVLTPSFVEELRALKPSSDQNGFSACFRYCIHGRPLRASLYPPRTILFRRTHGRFLDVGHGHTIVVTGTIAPFRERVLHDDRKPLARWLAAQRGYASLEADHLIQTAREQLNFPDRIRQWRVVAPWAVCFYLLFLRGLILDGKPGWFYVFQRVLAEMMLSLELIQRDLDCDKSPS